MTIPLPATLKISGKNSHCENLKDIEPSVENIFINEFNTNRWARPQEYLWLV